MLSWTVSLLEVVEVVVVVVLLVVFVFPAEVAAVVAVANNMVGDGEEHASATAHTYAGEVESFFKLLIFQCDVAVGI